MEVIMRFEITKSDFVYTGGGVWVLFAEIRMPNNECIYASTSDELCAFYNNETDSLECMNEILLVWFDEIKRASIPYKGISEKLFREFKHLKNKHKYD